MNDYLEAKDTYERAQQRSAEARKAEIAARNYETEAYRHMQQAERDLTTLLGIRTCSTDEG